ncbi:hypothetical protein OHA72_34625 [Dactylosporangium sp. NBC_01737]|uniref:hypothetical protein n=1 Tax=Dactylosporangium sp. NBC_01737 TaxID=2975959 RepID=UPI002E15D3BA|nr:hypothetical protein OHA72_34625 [Dactylosporangium sp. NBC_01737]
MVLRRDVRLVGVGDAQRQAPVQGEAGQLLGVAGRVGEGAGERLTVRLLPDLAGGPAAPVAADVAGLCPQGGEAEGAHRLGGDGAAVHVDAADQYLTARGDRVELGGGRQAALRPPERPGVPAQQPGRLRGGRGRGADRGERLPQVGPGRAVHAERLPPDNTGVQVRVDEPGQDVATCEVDHGGRRRCRRVLPTGGGDAVAGDQQPARLRGAGRAGPDRRSGHECPGHVRTILTRMRVGRLRRSDRREPRMVPVEEKGSRS